MANLKSLEILKEDELCIRMSQLKLTDIPVIDTTRKILVKRLEDGSERQSSIKRRRTFAATMLRSDEELKRCAAMAFAVKIKNPATSTTESPIPMDVSD